jgi:flagellar motor protein MotB
MALTAYFVLTGKHEAQTEAQRPEEEQAQVQVQDAVAPIGVATEEAAPVETGAPAAAQEDAAPRLAEPVAEVASVTWPEIKVPGAKSTHNDQELFIVFDYGLFARIDQLRPEAEDALKSLAEALLPHLDHFTVTVTGYTDNDPVPANRPYKTNYDLGMMRAMAVTKALVAAGMPSSGIATRSMGDKQAPYSNDTPANKARNRTAIISLRADN